MSDTSLRVKFAVRYPAGDGKWRYVSVMIPSYEGSGSYAPLEQLPAVGDLVYLYDMDTNGPRGIFRVLDRAFMWSSYGSVDWPHGEPRPRSGPLVDIIVEPSEGAYRDETPICAESTCEAVWVDGAWWMPPGAGEPDPHDHHPYKAGNHA